jgi:hypothetical protein
MRPADDPGGGGAHSTPALSLQDLLTQGNVADGHRSLATATARVAELAEQLAIPASWARWREDAQLRRVAAEFIVEVVLSAAWYTRQIGAARVWLRWYVTLLVVLILGVPLGLSLLGMLAQDMAFGWIGQAGGVVTGALTGIFALQKALAAWAAQRQTYGAWYRASAALKAIYYRTQSDWQGRVTFDRRDDFVAYLRARTEDARAIVTAEEQAYFDALAWPSVDLLGLLSATRTDTAALVAKFIPAWRAGGDGASAAAPPAGSAAAPPPAAPAPAAPPATPPGTQLAIAAGLSATLVRMNGAVADMQHALAPLPRGAAAPLHDLVSTAAGLAARAEAALLAVLPAGSGRTAPPVVAPGGPAAELHAVAATVMEAGEQLARIKAVICR